MPPLPDRGTAASLPRDTSAWKLDAAYNSGPYTAPTTGLNFQPFAYGVTIFLLVITRAVALFTYRYKVERGDREEGDHIREHGGAYSITKYSVYNANFRDNLFK